MNNKQNYLSQPQVSFSPRSLNGLKQYLDAENDCWQLKKRIHVLASFESHKSAKIKNSNQKINKMEHIRQYKQGADFERSQERRKRKEEEDENRLMARQNRNKTKHKIEEMLKSLDEEKIKDRNQVRQKSSMIADKIKQNKRIDYFEKRQKRNKVLRMETHSKQNQNQFFNNKKNTLQNYNKMEYTFYSKKKAQTNKELKRMNTLHQRTLTKSINIDELYQDAENKVQHMYKSKSRAEWHKRNGSDVKQNRLRSSFDFVYAK